MATDKLIWKLVVGLRSRKSGPATFNEGQLHLHTGTILKQQCLESIVKSSRWKAQKIHTHIIA